MATITTIPLPWASDDVSALNAYFAEYTALGPGLSVPDEWTYENVSGYSSRGWDEGPATIQGLGSQDSLFGPGFAKLIIGLGGYAGASKAMWYQKITLLDSDLNQPLNLKYTAYGNNYSGGGAVTVTVAVGKTAGGTDFYSNSTTSIVFTTETASVTCTTNEIYLSISVRKTGADGNKDGAFVDRLALDRLNGGVSSQSWSSEALVSGSSWSSEALVSGTSWSTPGSIVTSWSSEALVSGTSWS